MLLSFAFSCICLTCKNNVDTSALGTGVPFKSYRRFYHRCHLLYSRHCSTRLIPCKTRLGACSRKNLRHKNQYSSHHCPNRPGYRGGNHTPHRRPGRDGHVPCTCWIHCVEAVRPKRSRAPCRCRPGEFRRLHNQEQLRHRECPSSPRCRST